MPRLLILAGTEEARLLATELANWPTLDVEMSYAGLTRVAAIPGTRMRCGGFGGAVGFERHLEAHGIDLMIDATHPFAMVMPLTAREVCAQLEKPYLRLCRPPWRPRDGERWTHVGRIEDAAASLPANARVLVTSGRDWPKLAKKRPDLSLFVRLLMPPRQLPPAQVELIIARPPFSIAAERDLLRDRRCTHLLTKNAGGHAGRSKIEAAAALGLDIVVIERPQTTTDGAVEGIAPAVAWLKAMLNDRPNARNKPKA